MTTNPFTFKVEKPQTADAKNDLEIFNEMLKEISSDIIVDHSEPNSLSYYVTIKSESEETKLLELIGNRKID